MIPAIIIRSVRERSMTSVFMQILKSLFVRRVELVVLASSVEGFLLPYKSKSKSVFGDQKGMYLMVVAFAALVFVAFIALTIGLGFVATGKTRMQAVADLTATAALSGYLQPLASSFEGGDPVDVEDEKREQARQRAEQVLGENSIPGISAPFGTLGIGADDPEGTSGFLQFGVYLEGPDPDSQDLCGGIYPCFIEVDNTESINAVRLILRNQSDNPLVSRAAGLLGSSDYLLEVDATARIRETCTAYIVDVSLTSTRDRYPFASNPPFNKVNIGGDGAAIKFDKSVVGALGSGFGEIPPPVPEVDGEFRGSLFAYRADCLLDDYNQLRSCANVNNFTSCRYHEYVLGQPAPPLNPDLVHWCSMRTNRLGADPPPADNEHFRSDYVFRPTYDGDQDKDMFVAKYREDEPSFELPSPLEYFMRAFNAGLRLVDANANADRGLLMAFTGKVHNRIVPHPFDFDGELPEVHFTPDLGFLIQITNMHNIGQVGGEVSSLGWGSPAGTENVPNFFDKGFFPSFIGYDASDPVNTPFHSATNIIEAVWDAAEALYLQCPERARKQIVLATDGRASCRFWPLPATWGATHPENASSCDPTKEWDNFKSTERRMLNALLPRLQEANIALTTILSGAGVNLEFRNIENPNPPDGCPGNDLERHCYLNFETAFEAGYGGYNTSPPSTGWLPGCASTSSNSKSFFPCRSVYATGYSEQSGFSFATSSSHINHEKAFIQQRYIAEPEGPKFGRPINLFGHLAAKTGGVICPLLDTGPEESLGDYYIDLDSGGPCSGYPEPGKNPCILRNSVRTGGVESRALEYLPKVEQAARCIERAVGKDLFSMGRPLNVIE